MSILILKKMSTYACELRINIQTITVHLLLPACIDMYVLFHSSRIFFFSMQSQCSKDNFSIEKLENSKMLMNDVHDRVDGGSFFSSYKIPCRNRHGRGIIILCLFYK